MSDSRAFEGWRRLGASVMYDVARDDPAGLNQVREVMESLDSMYSAAMAYLAGAACRGRECEHVHYSHGEIARELGIARQAVSQRIARTGL